MKISYQKDVVFSIPHVSALGMDPPEGKELSDFVCWMGFEDKDEPYLSNWFYLVKASARPVSSLIDARIFAGNTCCLSNANMALNMYAVWDKYKWEDDLSGNAVIEKSNNNTIL